MREIDNSTFIAGSAGSIVYDSMMDEIQVRKRLFWSAIGVGIAMGILIGFVIGVSVADNVVVIPLGEGIRT